MRRARERGIATAASLVVSRLAVTLADNLGSLSVSKIDTPRRRRRLLLAAVVLATIASLWPVVTCSFIEWDDPHNVAANPNLNPPSWIGAARYWLGPFEGLYVPLTFAAWSAIAWVSQLVHAGGAPPDPHLFHVANLAAHLASAAIVFGILSRLIKHDVAAAVGAAVFAMHPIQVEAVAWVSGLKDVLAGMLGLLAIALYLPRSASARVPAAATAAFIAALLCKPSAVIVPIVAAILEVGLCRRSMRDAVKSLWPWLALSLPIVVITKLAQPAVASAAAIPWWARLQIAGDALAFYMSKLIYPVRLAIDYGRTPEMVASDPIARFTWLVPVAAALALAMCAWLGRDRARVPVVAAVVFGAALLPVLGLVSWVRSYSTVADHYVYLAMLGPALATAWAASRLRPAVAVPAATAVVLALGVLGYRQAWTWRDTRTALGHTLAVNPKSWMSHINLSVDALARQDAEAAIAHSRAALVLQPYDGRIHVNLGRALGLKNDIDGAINEFHTAIALDANDAAAHANLGDALAYRGDLDGAIREYRAALAIDPQHRSAARALKAALSRQGQSRPHGALPR